MTVEITIPLSTILAFFGQVPPEIWASFVCIVIGGFFIFIGSETRTISAMILGAGFVSFGGFFLAVAIADAVLASAPPLPPAWNDFLNITWPVSVEVK